MPETVNIGFIGCGGNARGHMGRLMKIEGAKIVAVCDVAEEMARKAAGETGAEPFTDHRKLLDRKDLSAVYVSIPVFAHGRPELDTIERGLPFLVEKPVAIDMGTAREIERRVKESGVITCVGYQLRYIGTTDIARQLLAGQRIGLASGKYWCDSGVGDPGRWLRQMSKSGGQLVEQATHTIDMMRFLVGEVSEVYCMSASQVLKEIDCADFNSVAMRFDNGAVGSLTTSWASSIGWGNTNVLDIMYENRMLTWTVGKLTARNGDQAEEHTSPGTGIDEIFVNAVRTGDRSAIRSPYSDAVISLAVSLAMNQSAREGRPVAVADLLKSG